MINIFKVSMHISGDDSALTNIEGTAGRRGLCGTLFTLKVKLCIYVSHSL